MIIDCLGTGSIGNCYLIWTNKSKILLDAGVRFQQILEKTNLSDIDFAFISHKHKDHSLNQEKLISRGVNVIDGSVSSLWRKNLNLGKFQGNVYTFGVSHGETICNGCIIEDEIDTILYITDFNLCTWNLSHFKFTSIILECNYCESMVSQELIDSDLKIKRQINTHMGLNGLITFLKTLDLSQCKEIILTHKSTDTRLYNELEVSHRVFSEFLIPVGICQHKGGIEWIGKDEFEL
jgi:ribonuclease BN (tRNA processing enzyme)